MRASFALRLSGVIFLLSGLMAGCVPETAESPAANARPTVAGSKAEVAPRPDVYAEFTLTSDLSYLSDNQRKMIGILIEAS
ncbi:MAG: hypothetical protein ACE1Z7_08305, partial [Woeseiaceae bacterium]